MPRPPSPRWRLVLATLAVIAPAAVARYSGNLSYAEGNRRKMTDLGLQTVIMSNQVCLFDSSNPGLGATTCDNSDLADEKDGLTAACSPQRPATLQILFDNNMDIGHNNLGAVGNADDQAKHDAAEGTDGIKSYGVNRAPASTACAKCGGNMMNEGPCANGDNQNHGEYEWILISCELWVGHPWFDAWAADGASCWFATCPNCAKLTEAQAPACGAAHAGAVWEPTCYVPAASTYRDASTGNLWSGMPMPRYPTETIDAVQGGDNNIVGDNDDYFEATVDKLADKIRKLCKESSKE